MGQEMALTYAVCMDVGLHRTQQTSQKPANGVRGFCTIQGADILTVPAVLARQWRKTRNRNSSMIGARAGITPSQNAILRGGRWKLTAGHEQQPTQRPS